MMLLALDRPAGWQGDGRILLRFAHLRDAPTLRAGDRGAAGQGVGTLGNSGVPLGAHLHFEVLYRTGAGEHLALDPWEFMSTGLGEGRRPLKAAAAG